MGHLVIQDSTEVVFPQTATGKGIDEIVELVDEYHAASTISTRTTIKPFASKAGITFKVIPALDAKGLARKYDENDDGFVDGRSTNDQRTTLSASSTFGNSTASGRTAVPAE
jgi:hypothetical protein